MEVAIVSEARRLTAAIGRALAEGCVADVLSVEATLSDSGILVSPAALEPVFRPVDPLQTFTHHLRPIARPAARQDWVTRRVILPLQESVDWARAAALVGGLAGCVGVVCLERFGR